MAEGSKLACPSKPLLSRVIVVPRFLGDNHGIAYVLKVEAGNVHVSKGPSLNSWNELVERHGPMVYRVALRIVGQAADAEDVVQEVFLEVHRLWSSRKAENWSALLRTLATRRAIDSLRRGKETLGQLDHDPEQLGAAPENLARAKELEEQLRAGIAQLPQQQAEVFTLHCLEGQSHQEIANELGITPRGVASALHKARVRLARRLSKHVTNWEQ